MKYRISIKHSFAALLCCALLCAGTMAYAHTGDVGISIEDGRIVTGLIDEHGHYHPGVRVFASEISERTVGSVTVFDTLDPGFDAEPGTLPVPSFLGFSFGDALKIWNGAGFSYTAGETMTVSLLHGNPLKLDSATTSYGATPGFDVAVSSDGSWHKHFTFRLNGAGGGTPTDGIYLLQLGLASSETSIAPSLPFWLVFGFNCHEEDHEEAIHWLEASIVPEPSGLTVFAGAFAGLAGYALKRRR